MAANAGMVRHRVGLELVWQLMQEGILCRVGVGLSSYVGMVGHCALGANAVRPCYGGHNDVPGDFTISLQQISTVLYISTLLHMPEFRRFIHNVKRWPPNLHIFVCLLTVTPSLQWLWWTRVIQT